MQSLKIDGLSQIQEKAHEPARLEMGAQLISNTKNVSSACFRPGLAFFHCLCFSRECDLHTKIVGPSFLLDRMLLNNKMQSLSAV